MLRGMTGAMRLRLRGNAGGRQRRADRGGGFQKATAAGRLFHISSLMDRPKAEIWMLLRLASFSANNVLRGQKERKSGKNAAKAVKLPAAATDAGLDFILGHLASPIL
jgi:hypothetical protein